MVLKLTSQDVLNLTNDKKRKAVLAGWQSWGIWWEAPEIGLSVHRLDLPVMTFTRTTAAIMRTVRVSISAARAIC